MGEVPVQGVRVIEVWVSYLPDGEEPGRDIDWGVHRFASVPRVGEAVTLWIDGEMNGGTVVQTFHYSRPVNGPGPKGDPSVAIRVAKK